MGKTDINRFKALLAKLEALGLPTRANFDGFWQVAYVTQDDLPRAVTLEDFFVGNPGHAGTFASNQFEHPGEEGLYALFQQVRQRPDVVDIWVGVTQIEYQPTALDDAWAYAEALYIVTTASPDDIAPEAAHLADVPDEALKTGWFGEFFPDEIVAIDYEETFIREGLQPPPPGYTIYMLWWD
jgi:hypothetical protein